MSDAEMDQPLCNWSLAGFRSIRDRTVFELGGLNLLVGANSAGKSSVLQSILMTAQTLGNPLVDRPLVLNGRLVRLGLAEDIVHEESHRMVELGFTLAPVLTARPARRGAEFRRLSVEARFAMTAKGTDFSLESTRIRASPPDSDRREQVMLMSRRSKTLAQQALRTAGLKGNQVRELAQGLGFTVEGSIPGRTAGVRIRQFLPDQLAVVANQYEQELEQLRWPYLRYGLGFDDAIMDQARSEPVSRTVLTFLYDFLAETYGEEIARVVPRRGRVSSADLAERLSPRVWQTVQDLAATDWFGANRSRLPFKGVLEWTPPPRTIAGGMEHVRRFFATGLRYLGPLRAAPQPLYGLPEAASGTSVGRDGEYTAAVLSAHARRSVYCPSPDTREVRQVQLSHAVDEWMAAMSLLSSVTSQERGKLGYELHVRVAGVSRDLDLTTVGVGVSQALPVIVLGLLSPPGSLLLFEQPELHLHPDVQASLGDFFLALARSGRQVIVETHSEYLVNRLRRRAATDSDDDVQKLARLFFFERRGSTSVVRAVRIGPNGSTPDWPRGFLDTAAREVEAIARERQRHP